MRKWLIEQELAEAKHRVHELEAFVQRFIDAGFEDGDLAELHERAVDLLPEEMRRDR